MVNAPAVDADAYFEEDSEDITPKHGTTVQAGWGAAAALLTKKKDGDYPTDFKFTEQTQLVRFLEDGPFDVYASHWIEREGKKSFVCLQTPRIGEDCPLCDIAGDKPRNKFAFNVVVLSDEQGDEPTVQILTAPPTFARQLMAVHEDPRRGPLTKFYWAISRQGTGPQTQYTLDRVKAADLAEEWDLDPEAVETSIQGIELYDASTTFVTKREELIPIARALVS